MASYFGSHFGGANELPGIVSKLCRSPIAAFAKKKPYLGLVGWMLTYPII